MKLFLKIICGYILLGIISVLYILFSNSALLSLSGFGETNVFASFGLFFVKTLPFIITMMFCAIRAQKKGERFYIRLIPFYLILGIIFSALDTFIDLKNVNEGFYKFIEGAYSFIQFTNYFLIPVAILENLNPNNMFSISFKIGSYVSLGVCFVAYCILYIKTFMVSKLPTVYGYDGFNFRSLGSTATTVSYVMAVSLILTIGFIILGFISDYAFESETIESDSLSYDELLAQANKIAEERRKEMYETKETEKAIDRSVSETTGMMNINNQLTAGSNVGEVNSAELGASLVEAIIPTSSGPVMNNTINATPVPQATQTPVIEAKPVANTPAPAAPQVAQSSTPVQAPVTNQNTAVQAAPATQPSAPAQVVAPNQNIQQ